MNYDAIAQLLQQRIGLDAAALGCGVVEQAARKRAALLEIPDSQSYCDRVRDSTAELQELVEAVVVPETWFFRDSSAFAALAKFTADEWLSAPGDTVLRVLSIPCATGEEPYSIAIALVEAGLSPARFHIDALDISLRALQKAETAVFRKNSFRGEHHDLLKRYFTATPQGHALCDSIRSLVHFRCGNLLNLSLHASGERYHVIFCRNVLIYFDPVSREAVLPQLADCLHPNGLLFVGPAETFANSRLGFVSSNSGHSFVYRKAAMREAKAGLASPERVHGPRPLAKKDDSARTRARNSLNAQATKASPLSGDKSPLLTPLTSAPRTPDIDSIAALADAGQIEEARARCAAYLAEWGDSPQACYLMALLEDSMGRSRQAIELYRKAIYLDPNHAEALSHLALLLNKQGNPGQARHLQSRARRIEERSR